MLQSDGPAFPGAASLIGCGNRIPLPTSFRITGPGDASICVAVDPDAPPSRTRLAGGERAVPARTSACTSIAPELTANPVVIHRNLAVSGSGAGEQ